MSNTELVKKAYSAFQTGDVPTLLETFSDNVEYHITGAPDIPYAGVFKGKEAIVGFLQNLNEVLEFTKFEVTEMITEGDLAVAFVDIAANVRANGNSYSAMAVHRIDVKDGQLARFEDFTDTKLINDAIQG